MYICFLRFTNINGGRIRYAPDYSPVYGLVLRLTRCLQHGLGFVCRESDSASRYISMSWLVTYILISPEAALTARWKLDSKQAGIIFCISTRQNSQHTYTYTRLSTYTHTLLHAVISQLPLHVAMRVFTRMCKDSYTDTHDVVLLLDQLMNDLVCLLLFFARFICEFLITERLTE